MRFQRGSTNPWLRKFACAGRGVLRAFRSQKSFRVHGAVALAVAVAAVGLQLSTIETCLVLFCVAAVIAAELFNTAFEQIARAITVRHNRRIRDALDMASGAVLVWALGASSVGLLIFGSRLLTLLGWRLDQ
jgi:diacylglycerol kinase